MSAFSILIFYLLNRQVDIVALCMSLLATLIFLFFRSSFLNRLKRLLDIDSFYLINENLKNEKILEIKHKINLMANTFKCMQKDFKFLMVGKINKNKAAIEFSQDLINQYCRNCENYSSCFCENINKKLLFENLMTKALESGKITKDDFFLGLQCYCNKENIIMFLKE